MQRIFDWIRQKKEYFAVIFHLTIALLCIAIISDVKWKILILVLCARGISYELKICFLNNNMIKAEKVAAFFHNILTFLIIVVGGIVLIAGLSKE